MSNKFIKNKSQLIFQAIGLVVILSILSFGYSPTCNSMLNSNLKSNISNVSAVDFDKMLPDHSCCATSQLTQANSNKNQLQPSQSFCNCSPEFLTQISQNESISQSIENVIWNRNLASSSQNFTLQKEVFKSVLFSTEPPSSVSLYQSLQKILI
jgi:hypothetical protein